MSRLAQQKRRSYTASAGPRFYVDPRALQVTKNLEKLTRNYGDKQVWQDNLEDMEVGDAIEVPGAPVNYVVYRVNFWNAFYNGKKRFSHGRTKNGHGIWRDK